MSSFSAISSCSQECSHPSSASGSGCWGSTSGDDGTTRAVPQTVRAADGLVDGDAKVAKEEPCRMGQGGDAVLASRDEGASG